MLCHVLFLLSPSSPRSYLSRRTPEKLKPFCRWVKKPYKPERQKYLATDPLIFCLFVSSVLPGPSVRLSVCTPVRPSVCLDLCIYLSTHKFTVYLLNYSSNYLYICQSVYLFLTLFFILIAYKQGFPKKDARLQKYF